LVTGFDIIFLWVARMVMAGLEFMGDGEVKASLTDAEIAERIPFKDIYMTGLIRDPKGRKMSKSLGNSPDPLDLIKKFGADGLRFGIVSIAPSGQDILFSEDRIEIGRHFCNKLWNACRFRQMSGSDESDNSLELILKRIDGKQLDTYDCWILGRLIEVTGEVEKAFARFDMPGYAELIYGFFWNDYCDWYVEASKAKLRDADRSKTVLAVIDFVLRQSLLLMEPLIPFITEELWHGMGFGSEESLIQATQLPTSVALASILREAGIVLDEKALPQVESIKELITSARSLKAEYHVGSKRDVRIVYLSDNATDRALVAQELNTIKGLIPADTIDFVETAPEGMPAAVTKIGTLYLDLLSAIDVEAERERLGKELAKLDKGIVAGESKLSNSKFVDNAPPAVVEGARKQLEETKAKAAELKRLLASLG